MKHFTAGDAPLGELIHELRKRKGFTLQQLADRLGRSVGFMSQIERGLSQPTVEDMSLIEDTLGVPASYFFSNADPRTCAWLTRPSERRTLNYAGGVVDYLVSPDLANRVCMLETVLAPGADSGERQIMESSEQAGYVLKGQLTMEVNGEQRILNPGDAFQIGGGTPCRYRNAGGEPVRVLWMFS